VGSFAGAGDRIEVYSINMFLLYFYFIKIFMPTDIPTQKYDGGNAE
jgi:hypothetical protein